MLSSSVIQIHPTTSSSPLFRRRRLCFKNTPRYLSPLTDIQEPCFSSLFHQFTYHELPNKQFRRQTCQSRFRPNRPFDLRLCQTPIQPPVMSKYSRSFLNIIPSIQTLHSNPSTMDSIRKSSRRTILESCGDETVGLGWDQIS